MPRTLFKPTMSSLGIGNELLNFRPQSLPRGVIGNTAGFGPAIQGSSPCGVALAAMPKLVEARSRAFAGFFVRGVRCGPLKPPVCYHRRYHRNRLPVLRGPQHWQPFAKVPVGTHREM